MKTIVKVILSLLILVAIVLVGAAISVAAMLAKGFLFFALAAGVVFWVLYLTLTEILG